MGLLKCITCCGARTKGLSRFLVLAFVVFVSSQANIRQYYEYDDGTIDDVFISTKNITSYKEQSVHYWQEPPPIENDVGTRKKSGAGVRHSSSENHNTHLAAVDIDDIISQHVHALNHIEYKFFMYDDPNITLVGPSVWPEGTKLLRKAWRTCANEILFDESLFVVLEHSSLRTFNPDEAQVFIAPIPNGRIFGTWTKDVFWRLSFNSLTNHEVFRKHQGHKHLLISTCFPLFKSYAVGSLAEHYDKIGNMTLVQSWDPNGVKEAVDNGYDFHEYQEYLTKFQPFTHSSISVGLGTRPNSSKSSIGWDMASNEQWLKEYVDSKFCLVIRGDSPHSKAFTRSIRVGCIPVIVADCLPIYAPVLKSTLNMSDYAIMLDERKFVENPEAQLLTLLELDESEIKNKIKHLAFAQKVMMLDHPESLFVPALLHEAVEAFKNV